MPLQTETVAPIPPRERCEAFLTAALRLLGEVHRSGRHAGLDSQETQSLEEAIGRIRNIRNAIRRSR